MRTRFSRIAVGVALAVSASGAVAGQLINGAGATFPYPIYSKWFDEYRKTTGVQINYQSIGSGGGIRQVLEGTVDFGASDGPMTDEQLGDHLRLSSETVAGIFLGKITSWNDPALVKENPGVALPAQPIVPIHRSDGSGTTYVFVDYLSKVSPEWAKTVGRSTSVAWPVGLGGKGNEGVTGLIKQTPNAIGYVELVYAVQNKLPYAEIKNRSGAFVTPTLESVTAAAAATTMPPDFRVSITDPAAPDAYPIASFTWLLIPSTLPDAEKGQAIVKFLGWMLGDGQTFTKPLGYAPLPDAVVAMERQAIVKVRVATP